jgi:RNA polymerase sigma-70 factor (ECF subfamily)
MGAMRSISTHWEEQFNPDEPRLESELTRVSPEGEVQSPLALVDSGTPNPERVLDAKQQVEEIERLFAEDTVASLIIEGFREGLSGPEVRAALGLSQTEYDTAFKRIHRKVRAIAKDGGSDV